MTEPSKRLPDDFLGQLNLLLEGHLHAALLLTDLHIHSSLKDPIQVDDQD
jgi:hypothetical protein